MNSGVSAYVHMVATVYNSFPIDHNGVAHISCSYCKFYSKASNKCYLTNEIIYKPESFTGHICPLEAEESEES